MLDFRKILSRERTLAPVCVGSKKAALETASELIATAIDGSKGRTVLQELLTRERLGSTALGDGVAIPHCRLDLCEHAIAVLLRLAAPIDFDAPDDAEVDLLFVLVVPKEEQRVHLDILGVLARCFSEPDHLQALRQAEPDALFDVLQNLLEQTMGE